MAVRTLATGGLTIPPASAINAVASARGLAAAGARSLVPVTYGVDRQPALILNVLPKAGDANTLLVQCLWGHALHQVDQLQLNDQALPAGAAVTSYTGSQTTADAVLVAAFAAQGITYTDTLAGYAYSVLAMPTRSFDGQLNVSARLYGRRVYDPRKDSTAGGSGSHRLADSTTWAWSDCPALCLADWCANPVYGAGEPVQWASVPSAADANDSPVGPGAGQKRRLLGLSLARDGVGIPATAEALRAYAGCWLVPTADGLRLLPDADAAPVASYSHALGQIARLDALQLRDLGNVPTAVEVRYTDTSQTPWRDASATASVPGAGSTKPWRLSTVQLPGVQRHSQAMREAVERLNKLSLGDLSTTLEVFDAGIAHDIGDIITITHPVGLSAKPMRVTDVDSPGAGRWRLAVAEHDAESYSNAVVTSPSQPDTNRTAAGGPVSTVTDFAGAVSKGRITWVWAPAADPGYAATELRTSDADWGLASPPPAFRGAANTWGQVVSTPGTVTLYARHFDTLGNASATAVQASVPVISGDLVQDGVPGEAGEPGPAGLSVAEINTYIRSSSAPPAPTGGSFNFSSQTLTPPSSWSVGVPSGIDPVYVARGLATTSTPGATVTPSWGSAAAAFADGQAVDVVFIRSSSAPSTPPPSNGVPSGWSATVAGLPAGSDPVWSSFGERSAPGSSWVWQAAVRVQGLDGEQGEQGIQGLPGSPGTSVAEVNVYQRSASAPSTPSGGSFNFSTQALTAPGGWSVGVPTGDAPAYVARGIATAATLGATATPTWSAPALAFSDGQSVDVIYRRAASQPSTPAATAGVPSGWYSTVASVPASSDPLWSSFGRRPAPASNWTWEDPVRVQGLDGATGGEGPQGPQGPAGLAGDAGTSVAELNVYIRSSSEPPAPSGGSFSFSSLALTPPGGWSVGVPGGTDPVYVARGFAYTATPGAAVTPAWGSVAVAFADGQAVDVVFARSSSQPATPSPSSGVPAGWYATVASVPAGADPLWSTFGERSSINANWVWQAAVRVQGVDGAQGEPGIPAISASLTRYSAAFTADSTGVVDGGQSFTSTMSVLSGASEDTGNWTISRTSSDGSITTTISGAMVTITGIGTGVETGTVTITATRSGYPNQTLLVQVSKIKRATPNAGPVALLGSLDIGATAVSPSNATAHIRLMSDGRILRNINGGSSVQIGSWYLPTTTGIGASYEARFDQLSVTGPTSGVTHNAIAAWGVLSTDREIQLRRTEDGGALTIRVYSIAVRQVSDGLQVGAGQVYIEVAVELP